MNEILLKSIVRDISDFPKKGIVFKDISTVFQNVQANQFVFQSLLSNAKKIKPDIIIGAESRGFIYANAIALELNIPFVMVRKKGKLPYKTISAKYDLEYGASELELHVDSIKNGNKILIHDDVLATGGTVACISDLVNQLEGKIVGFSFLMELSFLNGRNRLNPLCDEIFSVIKYD